MCELILKKLYVDDIRDPPSNSWDVARDFHTAIYLLDNNSYDLVSLDNDLGVNSFYGNREMQGYDILQWLINRKKMGAHVPDIVKCHSANPVRANDMMLDIERYFDKCMMLDIERYFHK